jgi:hypothetical protein
MGDAMKSLFRLAFCVLLFAGWGLAGLSLHVVRTPTAIGLIPKSRLGVVDTYVDTRHWKMSDVADHPLVVRRVLESGQADLLHHITGEQGKDLEGRLADALKHPQRYATTTQASKDQGESNILSTAEASIEHWWDQK